jgi:hypothetical protein
VERESGRDEGDMEEERWKGKAEGIMEGERWKESHLAANLLQHSEERVC